MQPALVSLQYLRERQSNWVLSIRVRNTLKISSSDHNTQLLSFSLFSKELKYISFVKVTI